jgi:hypothetical protein
MWGLYLGLGAIALLAGLGTLAFRGGLAETNHRISFELFGGRRTKAEDLADRRTAALNVGLAVCAVGAASVLIGLVVMVLS